MKKVVRTSLNNVANKRGVRDLNIQLYSYDKNNAGFEFVIKNEVDLSEYKAKVLFDFQESFATWETKGTIEGNIVKVKFDTTFITKCEEVIGYLFLDSETDTLDVFKFKFNVVLSEIDKYDTAKRGFRYIKDQEVVDVITRSELREELSKIQVTGGVDLNGYLTTSVANETFATKQELGSYATKEELPSISGLVTTEQLTEAKNSVVEEINNKGYVTSTVAEETYAKKSDLPTPYNDSELVQKIGQLEARVDKDTVYDDTNVKERLTTLENKPPVDLSNYATKQELANVSGSQLSVDTLNLVTRQELEDKHYATEQSLNNYALKSELPQPYNDSALVQKIGQLEARVDNDTVYDDTALKERVTALESKAIAGGVYDDTHLRERLDTLEAKQDKDTVYDDTNIKERLTNLENKPPVDLSNYATKQELANVSGSQLSVDTLNLVTRQELEDKHYATEQSLNNYALKSELPQPYNDSALVQKIGQLEARVDNDTVYDDTALKERVTALESKAIAGGVYDDTHLRERLDTLEAKQDKDTVYDDTNIKERLTNLENKPSVDTSNFVTNTTLEEKHYVTNEQISSIYATKSEIPEPYSDIELVKRITVLENRQDNDTVYDDAELKRRVTALEEKPNVDTSNFVTTAVLESKGYLTTHQDISNLVTKQELQEATEIDYSNIVTTEELEPYAKKSELPEPYNDSALVSRVNALESKQATVYNDAEVKQRLTALENRPSTGGGTQDTGWIIISDDNPLHGNVVKIRRINDMVHVSLSNPNSEGLQLQFDDTVFRVILANKEIGKGFTPLNKLAIPVTEIESVMQTTTAETDVIGQVIFKVENGKAMMNGFGYKFSTSEPKEVHVNDFSYFTEDPFPTNLH